MKITTAEAEWADASVAQVREALASLDPAQDGGFVVVARDDGVALQMLPLTLERVEGGRVLRGSVPPGLVAFFEAFAEGRAGWDRGVRWTDASATVRADRRLRRVVLMAVLLGVLLVTAYLWVRLRS